MAARTQTALQAAQVLDDLRRYYRLSDAALAAAVGPPYTRNTVSDRRLGRTALDANDMDAFAQVFGVPPHIFLLDPTEAMRYVVEHELRPPSAGLTSPHIAPVSLRARGGAQRQRSTKREREAIRRNNRPGRSRRAA